MYSMDGSEQTQVKEVAQFSFSQPVIGIIAGADANDDVLVQFDQHAPKPARLVEGLRRAELLKEENLGREVVLLFEKGNAELPIIIALLQSRIENILALEPEQEKKLIVDGEQVTITANKDLFLVCGQASILLRKDGKVIIKGTNILSRSSGTHRIKGASVSIN